MTFKWARDYTLELIDQYSVAGTEVPATYNNQADYLHKIPRLLDDAATLAATTSHRIRCAAPLLSLEHRTQGKWEIFALPENCWQLCGSGILRQLEDGRVQRFHRFHLVGRDGLALPAALRGMEDAMLEYWRYPALLGEDPPDDALLDNGLGAPALYALPYYAAAHLVMLDNSFAYASLLNEFESKLAAGAELPQTEWTPVGDDYWGDDGWL